MAETVNGDAFRDRLLLDLRRSVTVSHERLTAAKAAGTPCVDPEHAFALAGMVEIHTQTGDGEMLAWARDDLLWLVQSAIQPDGNVRPFMTSLRHLQPFCEAFSALTQKELLSEGEREGSAEQIAASASSKFDYLDWGPHNRATVDGASLLWASRAVPDHPDALKWRQYGEALLADSWGHWSIEDASIYMPLWMVYLLTGAEAMGRREEFAGLVTTRYYFEYWAQLLTPNGMLPDWGDADWTLSWEWYVASFVAAGSAYRDGRYLWCAARIYDAYAGYRGIEGREGTPLDAYATYCAALALRWLDTSLLLVPYALHTSHEALEELVGKKIVFRNDAARGGAYGLFNYRDEGPYASVARDYLNQQLAAYEEKPHHGHADEQSLVLLLESNTVLLADGGYRLGITPEAYRADFFHNRIVARPGFPVQGDIFEYIAQNRMYSHVQTEKVHFGTFGLLDYSRTRLVDQETGYTGDRVVLFVPESGAYVVIDSIRVDRAGHKTFANVWHPEHVLH
ncbi:MAG TPA: hypothetical protein VGW38_18010, partial [Chloroflexota bacterium]|nr:hypothetical protein [Chloroflexota bacterium]